MLLRLAFICLFIFTNCNLIAQNTGDEFIIGSIDNEKITYQELKDNLLSSGEQEYDLAELKEFLPLYLTYKAKLLDAKRLGYYNNSSIREEHNLYSKQAAYNFWLDNQIKPDLFEEYYQRSNYELKASHILISPDYDNSITSLDEARIKANEARERLLNGEDFDKLNSEYSSSRNGQNMGGNLPWLSVGTTVGPFEDALYSLDTGEISEPVETQFGIHIIRLEEKREKQLPRRVQHVFVRPTRDSTAAITVYEAYQALQTGKDWPEVVSEFSGDEATKFKAGDIGWVSYGTNYAAGFIDFIMNLDPDMPYSEPFRSPYGYHIIRIDSVQSYDSDELKKEEMQEDFENTPYFRRNNSFVINYIREYYGDNINEGSHISFKESLSGKDSTLISDLMLSESTLSSVLYTFNDVNFSGTQYLNYLKDTRGDRYTAQYNDQWFENYVQYVIDDRLLDLTIMEFPEFQDDIDNYLDGLVIFQLNNDFMWSGETVDVNELLKLYLSNIDKYALDERAYYHLISTQEDSVLRSAIKFIESGNEPDSLRKNISGVAVNVDSTNTFSDAPFDRLSGMKPNSFSDVFDYKNRKAVFYLNDILPARTLSFEEAFDRLLTDYQPKREEKWLQDLRVRYNISYDMDNLEEAYRKERNL